MNALKIQKRYTIVRNGWERLDETNSLKKALGISRNGSRLGVCQIVDNWEEYSELAAWLEAQLSHLPPEEFWERVEQLFQNAQKAGLFEQRH